MFFLCVYVELLNVCLLYLSATSQFSGVCVKRGGLRLVRDTRVRTSFELCRTMGLILIENGLVEMSSRSDFWL